MSISVLLTTPKPLIVWITINCGKFWKRWEYQTNWLASGETSMQVRKPGNLGPEVYDTWFWSSCLYCFIRPPFLGLWNFPHLFSNFHWNSWFQWNQSVVSCPVLTVSSWPAYRFLKRQVRWSAIPISLRIFQFVVVYKVKDFGLVIKAEVDVFLKLSCFFWWSNGCWQFDLGLTESDSLCYTAETNTIW